MRQRGDFKARVNIEAFIFLFNQFVFLCHTFLIQAFSTATLFVFLTGTKLFAFTFWLLFIDAYSF